MVGSKGGLGPGSSVCKLAVIAEREREGGPGSVNSDP